MNKLSEQCHRLIGRLYERPPEGLTTEELDLIKLALRSLPELKRYEDALVITRR